MKGFIVAMLFVLSSVANAARQEVSCEVSGFSQSPELFHDMVMKKEVNTFTIEPGYVQFGSVTYDAIPPDIFDLDGIAITYFDPEERAVLYLYVNDKGLKEIGISNVEMDTDSFFKDKRVFTQCEFTEEGGSKDVASKPLHRTETGGGK